ncbi:Papain family cysteine protease [Poseidonocella pacifica]|uniref:Papain family cysteine protease n=1 Tax=Poseidonocella pacifica TaxID=871651 RepID=A0A1I0X6W7_9RHOB|nr:C1 family peptidase [Poseidonocella pacifica]SFA96594.1 Papain family cysteine protease [Poseidonocella pacifica]
MAEPLDLKQLSTELKDAGQPWEMDERTSMAMLTENERRIRLGFNPPPGAPTLDEAVAMDKAAPPVTSAVIAAESGLTAPASFDHRNVGGKNFTTPVKNQGSCGSCVAHGVAAVMETTYRRSQNNPNLDLDLSEAHLFYCHGGEEGRTCANGWFPDAALDKCKDKGITLESVYPYSGSQQACAVPNGWEGNMARVTGRSKLNGRAAIKEWIAQKGSVTGCFIVYQDFFSYRSGVYKHVSGNQAGGHCVEIIGYNDAQGCWICKNSWGPNWGEGGFFRIAYGQCQIDTWYGPYGANGVTLKSWANNVKVNGLWTNESSRNAWAHIAGTGWKKLTTASDVQQHAMLAELIGAKAGDRSVRALIDGNQIKEVYVT